jgi:hypothetical protein
MTIISILDFLIVARRTHERPEALLDGAEARKIGLALKQAEIMVGTAAHDIGVMIVLAVILPEADLADLETSARTQGPVPAARTAIAGPGLLGFDDARPHDRKSPQLAA